jgi:hypothetical protein
MADLARTHARAGCCMAAAARRLAATRDSERSALGPLQGFSIRVVTLLDVFDQADMSWLHAILWRVSSLDAGCTDREPPLGSRIPRPGVAAGAAVRTLHDAPLPPWPSSQCQQQPARSSRGTVECPAELDSECRLLVANNVVSADVVRRNSQVAEAALRPWAPVFIHGDLQIVHVLDDGDEASGVGDWSEGGQRDAMYDLATLTLATSTSTMSWRAASANPRFKVDDRRDSRGPRGPACHSKRVRLSWCSGAGSFCTASAPPTGPTCLKGRPRVISPDAPRRQQSRDSPAERRNPVSSLAPGAHGMLGGVL